DIEVLQGREPVALSALLQYFPRKTPPVLPPNLAIDVRLKQGRLVELANQRIGVQIAFRALKRHVTQEVSSLHSLAHGSPGKACSSTNRGRDHRVFAFPLLHQIPVITCKQFVA